MHPLIDATTVELIRRTGATDPRVPPRPGILERHELPYDCPADNAVITGCLNLATIPQVIASLARIFERGGLSYTFLSTEYCCGNYLYRTAVKERDQDAIAECRELSREFLSNNLAAARRLGARRLVIFCSPCYPIYKHLFPDEDIVFYPEAIAEVLPELELPRAVDYYPGCYKLHRRLAPVAMDLGSTEKVWSKIKGIELNRIAAPQCCFKSEGLAHMVGSVRSDLMIHICTGCHAQASQHMPNDRDVEILMLPELVERAWDGTLDPHR